MQLGDFFKGLIDANDQPVVICDLEHIIVYMNPAAAKRYEAAGGINMIGSSIFNCHNANSQERIKNNVDIMKADRTVNKVFEIHSTRHGANNDVYTAAIRDENGDLIGYYEKFEDKNLYEDSSL